MTTERFEARCGECRREPVLLGRRATRVAAWERVALHAGTTGHRATVVDLTEPIWRPEPAALEG